MRKCGKFASWGLIFPPAISVIMLTASLIYNNGDECLLCWPSVVRGARSMLLFLLCLSLWLKWKIKRWGTCRLGGWAPVCAAGPTAVVKGPHGQSFLLSHSPTVVQFRIWLYHSDWRLKCKTRCHNLAQ